jgi:hypothetical protein
MQLPISELLDTASSSTLKNSIRSVSKMAAGKIIWDFDATQSFPTTNGIPANGGSFSSTGPTLVDGMLYVNSGYGGQGMAGNVLLAFSVN